MVRTHAEAKAEAFGMHAQPPKVEVFRSNFSQHPIEDSAEGFDVQSLQRLHVTSSIPQHHSSTAPQQHSTAKGERSVPMTPGHENTPVLVDTHSTSVLYEGGCGPADTHTTEHRTTQRSLTRKLRLLARVLACR